MIPDAAKLFAMLQNTEKTIKLFYVKEGAVEKAVQEMPNDVPPVPSIRRMHQAATEVPWPEVVGKCSVVKYEGDLYPGIIINAGETC